GPLGVVDGGGEVVGHHLLAGADVLRDAVERGRRGRGAAGQREHVGATGAGGLVARIQVRRLGVKIQRLLIVVRLLRVARLLHELLRLCGVGGAADALHFGSLCQCFLRIRGGGRWGRGLGDGRRGSRRR